jgi:N utilization substance protein B
MSFRHKSREVALQILYRLDVSAAEAPTAGPPVIAPVRSEAIQQIATAHDLTSHFEHFRVPEEAREFAAELVSGTLREQTSLDAMLEKQSANWKVSRMAHVDRSLLRMALYELLKGPGTPAAVVIDEAVELAKHYGNAESPAFINGILDAIRKSQA